MKNYTTTTYGEAIAGDYDELYAELDVASAVDTLAQLAGGGRVLELGIGQAEAVGDIMRRVGFEPDGPPRNDLAGIPRALVLRHRP